MTLLSPVKETAADRLRSPPATCAMPPSGRARGTDVVRRYCAAQLIRASARPVCRRRLVLEWVVDLRWSMAVCGLVALIAVLLTGRRLDKALAEELRS